MFVLGEARWSTSRRHSGADTPAHAATCLSISARISIPMSKPYAVCYRRRGLRRSAFAIPAQLTRVFSRGGSGEPHLSDVRDINVRVHNGGSLPPESRDVRERVYCDELGWLTHEQLEDERDAEAVHFIAEFDGQVIASARMSVCPVFFPMEQYFDVSRFKPEGCAEISRLSVLPDWRHTATTTAVFWACYRYALANRIVYFCIEATEANSILYRRLGFESFAGTATAVPDGNLISAYFLDLREGIEYLRVRRPHLHEYFIQPIEGIG